MESKTCVWFLQSLWKAGSLFPPRVPLLDTLLADSSSLNGMRWLFQDKKGLLKRKSQENCTYDRICRKFMDGKARDAQVASLISGNEFRLFTAFQFQDFMSQGHLTVSSALQLFPVPSSDLHNRYILHAKITGNKLNFKYEVLQMVDGKATLSLLTAQNYCQTLRDIEKEVRSAIESHCKCKVVQLKLVFMQDQDRVLWLMGCEECFLYPLETFHRIPRDLTPTHQLDPYDVKPRLRTSISARRPPRSIRKDSHCEQPSIMSNASSTHFLLSRKNKCPGDFCKYVLSVPPPLRKTEADVDDLVCFTQVMTIKRVNSVQGQREAVKFRMSLAADFLQREREKLHQENLTFTISMRYLLLGRKLLLGKEDVPTDQEICEIDLTNMFQHTDMLKDVAKENEDIADLMQTSPFHMYSEVHVCERCYAVYNLIRKACMKEFAINSQRQKSATPKRRRLNTADTRSISPSSTIGAKDTSGCYISPLGKMHKYSLNDMLADIGHQQAELENEQAPNALKAKLLQMYKGMTLEEGKRLEEERKIEALRKRPLLDTKLRDPGSVEEMGRRLFPTGSRNALNVLPSSEKNLTKWRSFLNKRRQKSKDSC